MSELAPTAVYSLCLITSLSCAILLLRAYRASRTKLLLFSAIGFGFIVLNNALLVADMIILPGSDLWFWRQASSAAAVGVLLYGFSFEVDR